MNKFKILALAMAVMLMLTVSVSASADVLSLYKNKETDNLPFRFEDKLPGDEETRDYCVRVSYNGTITVHFKVDNIRCDSELYPLTDVLECEVRIDGITRHKGYLRDVTDIPYTITGVKRTQDIDYEIKVRLDTSVGNDYQNKKITADFVWWVEVDDNDKPGGGGLPGGGGGDTPGGDAPGGDTPGGDTPDDPDNPNIPDDPNTPDGPGTPAEPGNPDNPGVPGFDPNDPDAPGTVPGDKPISPEDMPGTAGTPGGKKPTGELIKPPNTGDFKHPLIYITGICVGLFIIFILVFVRKRTKNETNKTIRRLMIALAVVIILAVCLCITTFALIYSISVDNNVFSTGTVKINLNDEKPIIKPDEFLFEPGMTVRKRFFIENESSDDVYYKIYFENVDGDLADALDVTISYEDNSEVLYHGKARNLKLENSNVESEILYYGETRWLYATFHFPEDCGNSFQNAFLQFDMSATATQVRNNPKREF